MDNLPKPLNVDEQYMHAMVMRLDALCHMMDSFLTEYAKQNKIATTNNTTTKKTTTRKRTPAKKKEDDK